jgi:hypothetical protein
VAFGQWHPAKALSDRSTGLAVVRIMRRVPFLIQPFGRQIANDEARAGRRNRSPESDSTAALPTIGSDPTSASSIKAVSNSDLQRRQLDTYGVDSRVIGLRILPFVKRRKRDAGRKTRCDARTPPDHIDLTPPDRADRTENPTMAPNNYLDALNKSLNAELVQWGGSESTDGVRRRGRTLAALLFGASTVVGVGATEELPAVVAPSTPTTTAAVGSAPIVPAHFRPAPDRSQVVSRVLATAKTRVQNDFQPAQAVATLALEIGRLQRDLAVRSPEGMEDWIGGEYASLEAVRRAIADAIVDEEEPAIVAFALNCASQLLAAAAA